MEDESLEDQRDSDEELLEEVDGMFEVAHLEPSKRATWSTALGRLKKDNGKRSHESTKTVDRRRCAISCWNP